MHKMTEGLHKMGQNALRDFICVITYISIASLAWVNIVDIEDNLLHFKRGSLSYIHCIDA